jgi:hypothetical protein
MIGSKSSDFDGQFRFWKNELARRHATCCIVKVRAFSQFIGRVCELPMPAAALAARRRAAALAPRPPRPPPPRPPRRRRHAAAAPPPRRPA